MAGAQALARLRRRAVETRPAARASTICAAGLPISALTSPTSRTSAALKRGVKWRSGAWRGSPSSSGRPSAFHFFRPPFEHARRPRGPWRGTSTRRAPPSRGPRCRRRRCRMPSPMPIFFMRLANLVGRGQHVRQRRRLVGDVVDVEEQRAGDVLHQVFGLGVALARSAGAWSRRGRRGPGASRCAASQSVSTSHVPALSSIAIAPPFRRTRRGCAGSACPCSRSW